VSESSQVAGGAYRYPPDQDKIERILALRARLGDRFPRYAVFVVAYNAQSTIASVLARIPPPILDLLEEVYVFDDFSTDRTAAVAERVKARAGIPKLNIYRNRRNYGYGGNQKIGYDYALRRGYDFVILLHGDGQYPPEYLPDLMLPTLEQGAKVVFGSRMLEKGASLRGGMPLYKYVGNRVLTVFENFVLHTRYSEYHSGYRCYATEVLRQIAYNLNTDDFHFDTQIITQCRALGVPIHEVPVPTFYGNEICHVNGMLYALNVVLSVLDYRLHQLGLTRKARYEIKRLPRYEIKRHPTSSQSRLLARVRAGARILYVRGHDEAIARGLRDKGCTVIGVGQAEAPDDPDAFDAYHPRDLERPLDLPEPRRFDYVLLPDVIEHVRNAQRLLAEVRRYLGPDGRLLASTGNIALWLMRLSLLCGRFEYGERGLLDRTHVHLYTVVTFRELLADAGYRVVDEAFTPVPFELVFRSTGRSRLVSACTYAYQAFARVWPRLFAYQTLVTAADALLAPEAGGPPDAGPNPEPSRAAP